jgi:hypothetical protein
MHGAGDMKLSDTLMRDFEINENFRNNSDNFPLYSQRGLRDCSHETDVCTAINECDIAAAEGAA